MLERGTWWTTPVGTVQDRDVETYDLLRNKSQPVQFWASAENFRSFIDVYTRCFRRKKNEDGLYDLTMFGRRGLLGMARSDGVNIMRASGVGVGAGNEVETDRPNGMKSASPRGTFAEPQ